jgi:hypothetical protein
MEKLPYIFVQINEHLSSQAELAIKSNSGLFEAMFMKAREYYPNINSTLN